MTSEAQSLAEATRTIEQQVQRIEQLQAQIAANRFATALRDIMVGTGVAAAIAAPGEQRDVVRAVVETAAEILEAESGALFLLNEERGELVFQVALGPKAEQAREFRVPVGHGIAGYVAATGQPLAVADAQNDPRLARDIEQAVDYRASTILCVPLFLRDRVIGVLELLNKARNAPFSLRDMETLGRFSHLAALAIEQSRLAQDLRHLFRALLGEIVEGETLTEPSRRFADLAAAHAEQGDAIRLAGLVHELGRESEYGRRLALDVLTSVNHYLKKVAPTVPGL